MLCPRGPPTLLHLGSPRGLSHILTRVCSSRYSDSRGLSGTWACRCCKFPRQCQCAANWELLLCPRLETSLCSVVHSKLWRVHQILNGFIWIQLDIIWKSLSLSLHPFPPFSVERYEIFQRCPHCPISIWTSPPASSSALWTHRLSPTFEPSHLLFFCLKFLPWSSRAGWALMSPFYPNLSWLPNLNPVPPFFWYLYSVWTFFAYFSLSNRII